MFCFLFLFLIPSLLLVVKLCAHIHSARDLVSINVACTYHYHLAVPKCWRAKLKTPEQFPIACHHQDSRHMELGNSVCMIQNCI